jgi:hypothetical protein
LKAGASVMAGSIARLKLNSFLFYLLALFDIVKLNE